ncbi:MAG: lysoplasmalogenase [Eubacterium sp.]
MWYYIVLAVGVVVSLVFCFSRSKGFSVKNVLFKSVSSLCYLLTAVFALINNPDANSYGSLIIMGGALGLVGDICLDLKGVYKQDESTYLKAGFIFFLVGHIFYSSAIVLQTAMKWWIVLLCIFGSLIISFGNSFLSKLMKVHFGAYRKIVFIYVCFLSITMILSIVAAVMFGFEQKYVILALGAICFTLSDVVLSNTFFGRGKDKGYHFFINHFLYYAGQYLIAASVMFMK